jgi:hypothetical protein
MLKKFALLFAIVVISLTSYAQQTEVLYFQADLACCRAKACDELQSDIKAMIENKYNSNQVKFIVVKLSDATNKSLVEKHNASSQTVVIVTTNGRKETVKDISDIVKAYTRNRNKNTFENQLFAQLEEASK